MRSKTNQATTTEHFPLATEMASSSQVTLRKQSLAIILFELMQHLLGNLSPVDFIPENLKSISIFVLLYGTVWLLLYLQKQKQKPRPFTNQIKT